MSMRISVFEDRTLKKKSQMSNFKQVEKNALHTTKNNYNTIQESFERDSMGLYIKQIPRRPKSPFRKYEKAAIESLTRSKSSTSLIPIIQIANRKKSRLELSDETENEIVEYEKENKKRKENRKQENSKISSVLFAKRAPIDPNELKQTNNMKLVNNFEDLVIACVDSSTISKENSLICYKKKYLLNLTGANSGVKNEINERKNKVPAQQQNQQESKHKIKYENNTSKDQSYMCVKCKALLTDHEILENRNKVVHFQDEDDITSLEMENLKNEDHHLRKLVFEGDSDPCTFRRLEHISEVLKKYEQRRSMFQKHRANLVKTTLSNDKSFSESDFKHELKLHPLIRKNLNL